MPRNICKDRNEFFKVVFKTVIENEGIIGDYERFKDIPKDEYESLMEDNIYDIVHCVDGEKNVNVDTENVGNGGEYTDGGIDGLNALPTGELFWGFDCGGDWEVPVNAILYVENKKLKMYVPEKGNNFCEKHMCAWGSEPDETETDDNDDC